MGLDVVESAGLSAGLDVDDHPLSSRTPSSGSERVSVGSYGGGSRGSMMGGGREWEEAHLASAAPRRESGSTRMIRWMRWKLGGSHTI